jgi:hypothetical protein
LPESGNKQPCAHPLHANDGAGDSRWDHPPQSFEVKGQCRSKE